MSRLGHAACWWGGLSYLALCLGCQGSSSSPDQERPSSAQAAGNVGAHGAAAPTITPSVSVPSVAPSTSLPSVLALPPVPRAAEKEDTSRTSDSHRDCYRGFSGTRRAVDVERLGLLCGPANGFVHSYGPWNGHVDEDATAATHRIWVRQGDCLRVFAAADGVDDLEVEITDAQGATLSLANLNERWVVFPADTAWCSNSTGEFRVRLRTHGGGGDYMLTIWTRSPLSSTR